MPHNCPGMLLTSNYERLDLENEYDFSLRQLVLNSAFFFVILLNEIFLPLVAAKDDTSKFKNIYKLHTVYVICK